VASFNFAAEPGSTFECSLDEEPLAECESPAEYTDLEPGSHVFRVQATDAAGNVDTTPATYEWTILDPPETTIDSGPPATSDSSAATFTFSSDKAGVTFFCSLDGAGFTACSSPKTYTGLLDEAHTFEVVARDANGLVDETPALHEWTVAVPPDTTITSAPEASTTSTTAVFTYSANEIESTFECSLDGAAFAPCPEAPDPTLYTGLTVGPHTFAVRATDPEGSTDATPATYSWTVEPDQVAPETTITSVTPGSVIFDFASNEQNVTFECSLDGVPFAACTSPVTYSDLSPDGHTFEVRAVDGAGNVDPTPARYVWTGNSPDQTAPETTIETRVDANTQSSEASFSLDSDEPGATFECSLDGAPFEPCDSPREYVDLNAGSHAFEARAVDGANNVDPSPARYEWTIDSTAPDTTIEARVDTSTESTEASFSLDSDEPGSSFECSLDGAEFTACESPRDYTDLAVGAHEFRARAIDAAGNVDSSPASFEWTVQAPAITPPQTTIDSHPSATTTESSASFTFSADKPDSTYECSLDTADFASCSSPKEYTGLAVGQHELRVRATDSAGTTDDSPASYQWTVEAPPTCDSTPVFAPPAADSWYSQAAPSTTHGTDSLLNVTSREGARERTQIRFANPELPQGCTVKSAKLRLYSSSFAANRTLEALRVGNSWTELGINWKLRSAATGDAARAPSRSSAGYVEWNVTAQVQAMYGSAPNYGFLIRDSVETARTAQRQRFHSRETDSGHLPQLEITFAE
jgi:hypothetical protein